MSSRKESLEKQYLIFNQRVYRPTVSAVDYGGTLCCCAQLHLQDESFISKSSLENLEQVEENDRLSDVLNRLKAECIKRWKQDSLLPHDRYYDAELTRVYQCLCQEENLS